MIKQQSLLAFLSLCGSLSAEQAFRPSKIPLLDLLDAKRFGNSQALFWKALSEDGIIAVSGVEGLDKKETLKLLHLCMTKEQEPEDPPRHEQHLPDGTRLQSFASHTVPGPGGIQSIAFSPEASVDCQSFGAESLKFRQVAAQVTAAFADRLSSLLNGEETTEPLLTTEEGYVFEDLSKVVENGKHLEHFHSYDSATKREGADSTIDWHTDQGLFIVFTPGQFVDETGNSRLSEGFFIKRKDGSSVEVEFDDQDDLVIMLGDGVRQLGLEGLRVTPHALEMANHKASETRVWYGRMVLPPSSALHPVKQETFGALRRLLAEESSSSKQVHLGCSPSSASRSLETTVCEEGTMNCWHRCMSFADQGVSEQICADQGLDLACINPRSQLWTGKDHGDYFPFCIDTSTAVNATPYPTLPNYPRVEADCSNESFTAFVESGEQFDHEADLGSGGVLKWSVVDGQVTGKLAYNGIFGWIAIGLANPEGEKNGMHGGKIILGLPGSNYSAVTGLDLEMPTNVHQYMIEEDSGKAAFRHWVDSAVRDETASLQQVGTDSDCVEANDCFTALAFEASSIHGKALNLTGTDEMIWAANSVDYFVGYHSSRGRFTIDWQSGAVTMAHEGHDHEDHDHDDEGHEEGAKTSMAAAGHQFGIVHSAVLAFVLFVLTF